MEIIKIELVSTDEESGTYKTQVRGTSTEICGALVCLLQNLMEDNEYAILTKAFSYIMDSNNIPKKGEIKCH